MVSRCNCYSSGTRFRHTILGTEKILCVNVDYAGVTRLLSSRQGNMYVASVNGTEHVWDLLPRNQR
jgi:hypothetical protein